MAKLVGIERGPDGERENLAGVHVLHHHRAVERLRLLHRVVERALGHELDVLVDGEHEVLARLGLVFARAQHLAARIHGGVHVAGHAVQTAASNFSSRPPRPLSSTPT